LNEAEKVVDRMWAAARVHLLDTNMPAKHMPDAVEYSMQMDFVMASDKDRGWLTAYEMVTGRRPTLEGRMPFGTIAHVLVPKDKRRQLASAGEPLRRAEEGLLLGWRDHYSSTAKVLLSGNRVVHAHRSRVTYDLAEYRLDIAGVP
jgi:hypothetical protein